MSNAPKPRPVTVQTFAREVLERSRDVAVLVDFWADWCQPCHMLDPILERIAADFAGRAEVVRVNVDEEPQLAQQLQVRSLPTVCLIREGRVVDGFVGVRPEEEVRAMLSRHIDPSAAGETAGEDAGQRLARLEAAHAQNPADGSTALQLCEALAEAGEIQRAESLLHQLPVNAQTDQRADRTRAWIHFHGAAAGAPTREELQARIRSRPDDLRARHQLAARCVLDGDLEPAAEELLELMRRDRRFEDDLGRRALLALFAICDPELAQRYRRRLSSLLM